MPPWKAQREFYFYPYRLCVYVVLKVHLMITNTPEHVQQKKLDIHCCNFPLCAVWEHWKSLLLYLLTYLLTFLPTCLVTYSMEQSPSWEANWFSASQETLLILWNPKVCHHICVCHLFLSWAIDFIRTENLCCLLHTGLSLYSVFWYLKFTSQKLREKYQSFLLCL